LVEGTQAQAKPLKRLQGVIVVFINLGLVKTSKHFYFENHYVWECYSSQAFYAIISIEVKELFTKKMDQLFDEVL